MGQYYKVAIKPFDGEVMFNDRDVEGVGYIGAKLLEHSYSQNLLVKAVAEAIEKTPSRLAWVGDYADEGSEVKDATRGDVEYGDLWGDSPKPKTTFKRSKFRSSGKVLLNLDKKLYVPLTGGFFSYVWEQSVLKDGKPVVRKRREKLSPIPLLTAIGNGRGGGDYWGHDEDLVGTWTWDELSICSDKKIPKGFSPLKHLPRKKDAKESTVVCNT